MDGSIDQDLLPPAPLLERISYRQWVAVDVVLAGLFFAGALARLFTRIELTRSTPSPEWLTWALYATATTPIAVRRRWPEVSLFCVAGALSVLTVLGHSLAPAPVLALPFYSVILKHTRKQSLLVLALLEALALGAFIAAAVLRPIQGDVTFSIILVGATWFVGDSVRTRRVYQRGLDEQRRERRRRDLDRAQRAIVDERMAIARELHDIIAHSLSVIAIQSAVGRHVIDNQPEEARTALGAIEETSRSALDELRRVLGVLRGANDAGPEVKPTPTLEDLEDLVERVRRAGVPIEMRFSGGAPTLPRGLELSVYRIIQEALTNVVKHARSAHTRVRLHFATDELTVSITNAPLGAGPGATLEKQLVRDGDTSERHGIIGMRERAAVFGGTLTAGTQPDGSFEIRALLPLRDQS